MITASPLRESLPYRDCVGVAVFNVEGKVFIGRRKPGGPFAGRTEAAAPWQMPQGGIDKGEDVHPAALRELFEETNIRAVELIAEAPSWIHYDVPDDVLGIVLKGKYRGQRQRWLAFRFTGDDSEIDVVSPGAGQFESEFDVWRWEKLETLPNLIVPFKRQAYEQVVAAFADLPAKVRGA